MITWTVSLFLHDPTTSVLQLQLLTWKSNMKKALMYFSCPSMQLAAKTRRRATTVWPADSLQTTIKFCMDHGWNTYDAQTSIPLNKDSEISTSLDLQSASHHVFLQAKSEIYKGYFWFCYVPTGFASASSAFQKRLLDWSWKASFWSTTIWTIL